MFFSVFNCKEKLDYNKSESAKIEGWVNETEAINGVYNNEY